MRIDLEMNENFRKLSQAIEDNNLEYLQKELKSTGEYIDLIQDPKTGINLLEFALKSNCNEAVLELLVTAGFKIESNPLFSLFYQLKYAIESGDPNKIKFLIKHGLQLKHFLTTPTGEKISVAEIIKLLAEENDYVTCSPSIAEFLATQSNFEEKSSSATSGMDVAIHLDKIIRKKNIFIERHLQILRNLLPTLQSEEEQHQVKEKIDGLLNLQKQNNLWKYKCLEMLGINPNIMLTFRGDDRDPKIIFRDGFISKDPEGLKFVDKFGIKGGVCFSRRISAAACFPYQGNITKTYIYITALEIPLDNNDKIFKQESDQSSSYFTNTHGRLALEVVSGSSKENRRLLVAHEIAVDKEVPGDHIFCAIEVTRNWNDSKDVSKGGSYSLVKDSIIYNSNRDPAIFTPEMSNLIETFLSSELEAHKAGPVPMAKSQLGFHSTNGEETKEMDSPLDSDGEKEQYDILDEKKREDETKSLPIHVKEEELKSEKIPSNHMTVKDKINAFDDLFSAIKSNDLEKISELQERYHFNFNEMYDDKTGLSPLEFALQHNSRREILEYLVKEGAQVEPNPLFSLRNQLKLAIESGNPSNLEFLLQHGLQLNYIFVDADGEKITAIEFLNLIYGENQAHSIEDPTSQPINKKILAMLESAGEIKIHKNIGSDITQIHDKELATYINKQTQTQKQYLENRLHILNELKLTCSERQKIDIDRRINPITRLKNELDLWDCHETTGMNIKAIRQYLETGKDEEKRSPELSKDKSKARDAIWSEFNLDLQKYLSQPLDSEGEQFREKIFCPIVLYPVSFGVLDMEKEFLMEIKQLIILEIKRIESCPTSSTSVEILSKLLSYIEQISGFYIEAEIGSKKQSSATREPAKLEPTSTPDPIKGKNSQISPLVSGSLVTNQNKQNNSGKRLSMDYSTSNNGNYQATPT